MVTKQAYNGYMISGSLNLAKIHMVTKLGVLTQTTALCLNLAKIHMVTKPQTYFNICI